jgi:arsenate reductase-like glutaredoxin family protein
MEIRRLIEEAGIVLDVRDLEKRPLTRDEVAKLIGWLDVKHFLNPLSRSFARHGLDRQLPDRPALFELIASDNSLLRRPIIKTQRLMTVGCDRQRVIEMLQLSLNGSGDVTNGVGGGSLERPSNIERTSAPMRDDRRHNGRRGMPVNSTAR